VTVSTLRLGSRGSPLARRQAEWAAERLGVPVCLVWIRSEGDQDTKRPLAAFRGAGAFTAELHRALLEDRVDAAVHSLKDLPVADEEGVVLAAVPQREDPRDALVARDGLRFDHLPSGATVGTGSPRRAAQALRRRPDLKVVPLRGNVDTRVRAVREGRLDAALLALAGLRRLGLEGEASEALDPAWMLPAPGQGALALTARRGDAATERALLAAADVATAAAVAAERAVLHALGAGCHAPVGALADVADGRVLLRGRVLSLDGRTAVEDAAEGALGEAAAVGARLAARLLDAGAGPLLAARA
jgi:hydroxymethylbilane synthase